MVPSKTLQRFFQAAQQVRLLMLYSGAVGSNLSTNNFAPKQSPLNLKSAQAFIKKDSLLFADNKNIIFYVRFEKTYWSINQTK